MNVKIENGNMVITIPVKDDLLPSKSGKTLLVASTHGNQATSCIVNDKPLTVSVNAYIKA